MVISTAKFAFAVNVRADQSISNDGSGSIYAPAPEENNQIKR